jgi:hypothetical protein
VTCYPQISLLRCAPGSRSFSPRVTQYDTQSLPNREILVSVTTNIALSEVFEAFGTLDEYLWYLERRFFAVVLFDGSLLQVTYRFVRLTVTHHRLCFYPCPVTLDDEVVSEYGIAEYVDLLRDGGLDRAVRLRSPIRFDYDSDAAAERHPAVHLTFSEPCCRIPVAYPLSVGHFVRFVFTHFYPNVWSEVSSLRAIPCRRHDRVLQDPGDDNAFFDWRPPS